MELIESLKAQFDSTDVPSIIAAIETMCGPGSTTIATENLEREWLNLTKIPSESMQQALARVDALARDLAVYGPKRRPMSASMR